MIALLRRYGGLIGMIAVPVFFSIALPDTFLTVQNWINISQQISMLVVVAATMTVVMVVGDFDLSVGSMASLSGVVAASLFIQDWSVPAALATAMLVGLAGGLFNGFIVSLIGVLPFVATLATLTIFSGLAFVVSDGRTVFGRDIPDAFGAFARGGAPISISDQTTFYLPNLAIVAGVVVMIVWVILEQTTYGRRLYAIGANAEAAHFAGIPVRTLRWSAYAFTGVGGALAGLMYASRVASANPTQGDGLMLTSIAAVFLGMTLTRDGQARVLATLAGVVVLGVLDNGLTQLRIDSYVREVVLGAIILTAVGISVFGRRQLFRQASHEYPG
ncbi:MAG: ABC transporter permease [Rhodobacteraceae bacterium]|nr:ABC transporter permease [Paracoccaceae bacterium]